MTITMQGFILAATTAAEKCTLFLDDVKFSTRRKILTKSVECEM